MITRAGAERDVEAGWGGIDPFGGRPTRPPQLAQHAVPLGSPEPTTQPLPRAIGTLLGPSGSGGRRRRAGLALVVAVLLGLLLAGVAVALARPRAAVRGESIGYDVPPGWTAPRPTGTTAGGITLEGVASTGGYPCVGRRRARASVGHTFVVRGDGGKARTEDAARDFATLFAASFYGEAASVAAGAAAPITVDGVTGTRLSVDVTAQDGAAGCAGVTGGVTVVALPTVRRGRSGVPGVLLAVLQRDVSGGPATPAVVDERTVAGILAGLRLVGPPPGR